MTAVDAHTRELIEQHGHAVVGVPDGRDGYLGYTLGLGLAGLPELYTTAPLARMLQGVLNELAAAQRAAAWPWAPGQVIRLERGWYRVDEITGERMPMVKRLYGELLPAWRMRRVD